MELKCNMQIDFCNLRFFKGLRILADREAHIAVGIAREDADKASEPEDLQALRDVRENVRTAQLP